MRQMDNLIKLPQIYATSYFMIHSIDICDMLTNMMGCNKYVNVTFKFTKIIPFWRKLAVWAKFGPRFQKSNIMTIFPSKCYFRVNQ